MKCRYSFKESFEFFYYDRRLIFYKISFLKISFRITIRAANSLDQDQARNFVGPDLGPNGLERLSADDTSRLTLYACAISTNVSRTCPY